MSVAGQDTKSEALAPQLTAVEQEENEEGLIKGDPLANPQCGNNSIGSHTGEVQVPPGGASGGQNSAYGGRELAENGSTEGNEQGELEAHTPRDPRDPRRRPGREDRNGTHKEHQGNGDYTPSAGEKGGTKECVGDQKMAAERAEGNAAGDGDGNARAPGEGSQVTDGTGGRNSSSRSPPDGSSDPRELVRYDQDEQELPERRGRRRGRDGRDEREEWRDEREPEPGAKRARNSDCCYRCGGRDHVVIACTSTERDAYSNTSLPLCWRCDGRGHAPDNCPTVVNANPCYRCRQPGHFARDCPYDEPPPAHDPRRPAGHPQGGHRADDGGMGGMPQAPQQVVGNPQAEALSAHVNAAAQMYGYTPAQMYAAMGLAGGFPQAAAWGQAGGWGGGGYGGNGGYAGAMQGGQTSMQGGMQGMHGGAVGGMQSGIQEGMQGMHGSAQAGMYHGSGGYSGGGGYPDGGGGDYHDDRGVDSYRESYRDGGGADYRNSSRGGYRDSAGEDYRDSGRGGYRNGGGRGYSGYREERRNYREERPSYRDGGGRNRGGGRGRREPDTSVGKCFRCGEDGHWTRDCPRRPVNSDPDGCYKCGKPGHKSRDCTACYNCGEDGHRAADCRRPRQAAAF